MIEILNASALVIGYILMALSTIAGLLYVSWALIGWIIKFTGYWPYFYKTLMKVAAEHNRKKRRTGE